MHCSLTGVYERVAAIWLMTALARDTIDPIRELDAS